MLPMNATSVQVTVPTRVDNVVKPRKTLVMGIAGGTGYSVGSPGSAQTTITNNNVPAVHISGATTISPGGSAQAHGHRRSGARRKDTQVSLSFAGDAVPGTDYREREPGADDQAGQKTGERHGADVGDRRHRAEPSHRRVDHAVAHVVLAWRRPARR